MPPWTPENSHSGVASKDALVDGVVGENDDDSDATGANFLDAEVRSINAQKAAAGACAIAFCPGHPEQVEIFYDAVEDSDRSDDACGYDGDQEKEAGFEPGFAALGGAPQLDISHAGGTGTAKTSSPLVATMPMPISLQLKRN